jgi:hypothetical protein
MGRVEVHAMVEELRSGLGVDLLAVTESHIDLLVTLLERHTVAGGRLENHFL